MPISEYKLEVIVRDNINYHPIFKREVDVDRKGIRGLLKDLKIKGIDILGFMKQGTKDKGDWLFD